MVISMNPILVTLFGIEIRYYSVLILLGVILAYFLFNRETKKFEIDKDFIFNVFFWGIIIGILGARLYYVAFNWEYFSQNINEIWQIWQGGLAIHGGIIFGLITIAVYCYKHKFRLIRLLDFVVVPLILAQAVGRWGNFFNQEAYGVATTLQHLKSLYIPEFIIKGMYINGVYYTPTFLYESLWCIIGFIILLIERKMKFTKVGNVTATYLIWYGIGRFFIESLRTDSLIFAGFKVAQIVSIIMIIIGIIIIIINFKKGKFVDLYNDIHNVDEI